MKSVVVVVVGSYVEHGHGGQTKSRLGLSRKTTAPSLILSFLWIRVATVTADLPLTGLCSGDVKGKRERLKSRMQSDARLGNLGSCPACESFPRVPPTYTLLQTKYSGSWRQADPLSAGNGNVLRNVKQE